MHQATQYSDFYPDKNEEIPKRKFQSKHSDYFDLLSILTICE